MGVTLGGGGQVVEFVGSGAALGVFEHRLQDALRGVAGEGLVLALDVGGDVDARGDRRQRDDGTLGEGELGGDVIEFARLPRLQALLELLAATRLAAGPLEGGRGEQSHHAVVGMGGDEAIGREGEDDMRTQGADGAGQIAGGSVKVGAVERAVGIVEHLPVGDAEMAAGGGEFLAARWP